MGVNSLWDILGPSARPVRLEALSRKKLAVDASIWIYQFLKAVRDQEGNSLAQSHIVGFFRRICKLLYFGIHPIFVFDGGAPALKRRTITQRRERRHGKKESMAQAARKLLAIQVHRKADEANSKKTQGKEQNQGLDEIEDEDTIYLQDLPNLHPSHTTLTDLIGSRTSPKEAARFVKKDEYHLPELKQFKVSSGDSRIMPVEEFEEVSKDSWDIVDGIDINKIDPNSREFQILPMATQYMILSHLRLRSRLRMGFSKGQLEDLFPNSLDFSKFQIQQVQKRNFYTQKLMNVSGMGDEGNATRRIAGDKDRKYALVRNEDGWTLALDQSGSSIEKPITVEGETAEVNNNVTKLESDKSDEEDDIEWDDIPLSNTEETEEEKNAQKELISSIYSLYQDYDREENDFNEKDLKQAIENSKKDLTELLMKEEKALEGGILKWKDDLQSKEENGLQKIGLKDNSEISMDLPNFSLGQSMLFQEDRPKSKEIQNREEMKLKTFEDDAKSKQEFELRNGNEDTEIGKDISLRSLNNLEANEEVSQPDIIEKDPHTSEIVNERHQRQLIPTWFNEDISQTEHPNQVNFVTDNNSGKRKYQEDEEAGLISWNEAKEMMDNDQETQNEDSNSSIEEIQEDIDLEIVKENQIGSHNSPDSKFSKPIDVNQEKNNHDRNRMQPALDYDFEEEDEEQLIEQLKEEEDEHESFKTHIRTNFEIPTAPINTSVSDEQLLQEELQKAKRDSDEVTETMISDVQELLRRFGIPYITAPMEAEAQCAELLRLDLVDGIITDDSDCFLFGGDRVYKNMFNQKQYVECYIMNDINAKLGLSQDKLIDLALLLGSDYTEGIKGIGPVLAMEILAEFETLDNFKTWFDKNTKRTLPPDKSNLTGLKKSLLGRIKNGTFFLPDSFPDNVISDAYKSPDVDHDKTEFKWGVPSLDQIRSFLMYNASWSQARVDEVMVPLIRDMNRKKAEGTQSTIGEFFPQEYIQTRKEIALGKRMKTATSKLNKKNKP